MLENTFLRNLCLVVVTSVICVVIIHLSENIYVPMFFIVSFSFFGGILEPHKGWRLAIVQILIILGAFWANKWLGLWATVDQGSAFFTSHSAFFPSFIASFLSAGIKKL